MMKIDTIYKIRTWKSLLGSYNIAYSNDIISFGNFMGISLGYFENCNLFYKFI